MYTHVRHKGKCCCAVIWEKGKEQSGTHTKEATSDKGTCDYSDLFQDICRWHQLGSHFDLAVLRIPHGYPGVAGAPGKVCRLPSAHWPVPAEVSYHRENFTVDRWTRGMGKCLHGLSLSVVLSFMCVLWAGCTCRRGFVMRKCCAECWMLVLCCCLKPCYFTEVCLNSCVSCQ